LGGVLALRSGTMERVPALRVALLLQDADDQLVASSVQHELALSVPLAVDATTRRARIGAAVDRFELGALLERNPHRLSGGEKQRLAFATVWLESPDVLLLDEPLSFLDRDMRARVLGFVREMNDAGVAIVWSTPGGDDVELAREAIVLSGGRIAHRGESRRVRYARGEGTPDTVPEVSAYGKMKRTTKSCVRFESASFGYDSRRVLENIELQVNSGERVHVTGRNGSGKSTLLLLAGGALAPTSGRIERAVGKHGVLYLPQSPERLFFAETVMEEICFGLERRGMRIDAARQRAEAALGRVGLEPGRFAPRSPFELSFGEMRRVAFAIAWALEPVLLLLDEPASCLDVHGRLLLASMVAEAAKRGAAVLLASHEEAASLDADRALEVRDGVLVAAADVPGGD
jgi:energy-coupling factor transport system ATP-binding protein